MPFVQDTFSGATGGDLTAHTGETGATWTVHPLDAGNNGVISAANRVRRKSNTSSPVLYASGSPASAEYDVQADFVFIAVSALGLWGRMNTTTRDGYRVDYAGGVWTLSKFVGGTRTGLGTYSMTPSVNDVVTVKLEIRNATKKVYLNGVERISSTDNAVTPAGKAGIYLAGGNSDATGAHIDNFLASDAGGATVTGAASVAGSGTVSATGRRTASGQAAVSGTGAVSATGRRSAIGSAAVAGAGAVSATATRGRTATASVVGAGSINGAGFRPVTGAAEVAGSGAVSAARTRAATATAAITGTGDLAASAQRVVTADAAVSGVGEITAQAFGRIVGAALVAGGGSISATGRVPPQMPAFGAQPETFRGSSAQPQTLVTGRYG